MWTLRSSLASPYGRKVKIGADICGLADRISIALTVTRDPDDPIRTVNPLGKIPALELGDGRVLYDSRVILEFLDVEAGGGRIIPQGADRFTAMTLQALADGIMDANLLILSEGRFRESAMQSATWLDYQRDKVKRALTHLEASPPSKPSAAADVGHIAVACALGHLDFRFAGEWRRNHPGLVDWLAAFEAAVPSYARTAPRDA